MLCVCTSPNASFHTLINIHSVHGIERRYHTQMEIDPITGLPKELEVFENISKESRRITVSVEKRKFGKAYTIITGLDGKGIDLKDMGKQLKAKFACGGSVKNGQVELQGDYTSKMRDVLAKLGYDPENITFAK